MRLLKRSNRVWLATGLGVSIVIGYLTTFKPYYPPPSPEVEQLAIATTMTPDAQQLFYRQTPEIEDKNTFRTQCRGREKMAKQAIILGCYSSNGRTGKIVLQSVTDGRLQGLMQVTAAHEMLHVAYEQMSQATRDALAPKLRVAVKRVRDPRLAKVLKEYEVNDPSIYINELHSHLGTELRDLGDPDLEKHYQAYFKDRSQVVAFAERSQSALATLDAKAKVLKPEIDALERSLKTEADTIKQIDRELKASLDNLSGMKLELLNLKERAERSFSASNPTGDISLVSQFEADKTRFNNAVLDHNEQIQQNQDRIATFNQQLESYRKKVKAYNELAQKERSILSVLKPDELKIPPITLPQKLNP
jgi:hypothetical protein